MKKSGVQRVSITIALGLAIVLIITTAYDNWRKRNGWCIKFFPDGREKILYGDDCDRTVGVEEGEEVVVKNRRISPNP